ncbi:MAG: amidophosphoribosyltransferase, partial [Candidatus Saccharimonadales bacterium]
MAGEAREKCAVGGILLVNDETNLASAHLYEVLFALQHRGTEASGMATKDPGSPLESHRDVGMVRDVYDREIITRLSGRLAVGHNRYSTSGSKVRHHQPVIDEDLGLAMAHNGNIPDTAAMDTFLEKYNLLYNHLNDSEKMGLTIAQFMHMGHDLPTAIEN